MTVDEEIVLKTRKFLFHLNKALINSIYNLQYQILNIIINIYALILRLIGSRGHSFVKCEYSIALINDL